MQINNAAVGFSSELYSANKVLRGTDVMVDTGQVFSGGVVNVSAVGGQLTNQLINPVGSGKLLFIDSVEVMLTVAGSGGISFTGVAAPTGVSNCVSQKDGLVFGSAQTRLDSVAPGAFNSVGSFGGPAFTRNVIEFPFPLECSPGKGVNVVNDTIAGAFIMVTIFHTREFIF